VTSSDVRNRTIAPSIDRDDRLGDYFRRHRYGPSVNGPGKPAMVWTRRIWRLTDPDRPRSAAVLVVANLVPLVGAVLLGWNVGAIVVLYWFESVIVGILNVPKMALAKGGLATSGASTATSTIVNKVVAIPFYGVFLLLSGVAALYLATAAGGSQPQTNFSPRAYFALLDLPVTGLILAAVGLLVSHLVSFNDFLIDREYAGIDPTVQMFAPYPRVAILLAAALASGSVVALMGSPVWAVASFVVGKILLELRLAQPQRRRRVA
jgi:hypothetical protein